MTSAAKLAALCAVAAAGAPLPTEFYVVTEAETPSRSVVHAMPEPGGTLVRLIRIAPLKDLPCGIVTVKSVDARVAKPPAEIAAPSNPCAVSQRALKRALGDSDYGGSAVGIVATCGGRETVLHLPHLEHVALERLQREHPEVAALWDLQSEVLTAAFGGADPFPKARDWEQQLAGQSLEPELRAGRFDKGFRERGSLRQQLWTYVGPISEAQQQPQLVNAGAFRFVTYVEPVYPPLARQASIQGRVEVELAVDRKTGLVRDAAVISGHPLLSPAVILAVKEWALVPGSLPSDKATAAFEFITPPCRLNPDSSK